MDPKSESSKSLYKSKSFKQTVEPKDGENASNKPEADGSFPSDDELYKPWAEPERSYHSEESRSVDYGNEPAESDDDVNSAKRKAVTYSDEDEDEEKDKDEDEDEDEDDNAKSKSKSSSAKSKSVGTSSKSAKSKSARRSSSRFSSK